MRFMMLMIPKGYESARPGTMPDAKAVEAMMKYNESLKKAGVLLALDGLHPPSRARASASPAASPRSPTAPSPSQGGAGRLLDDRGEVAGRGHRLGLALPGSENETIEIRQVQEMEDFPPDVQKAAEGFSELQKR